MHWRLEDHALCISSNLIPIPGFSSPASNSAESNTSLVLCTLLEWSKRFMLLNEHSITRNIHQTQQPSLKNSAVLQNNINIQEYFLPSSESAESLCVQCADCLGVPGAAVAAVSCHPAFFCCFCCFCCFC